MLGAGTREVTEKWGRCEVVLYGGDGRQICCMYLGVPCPSHATRQGCAAAEAAAERGRREPRAIYDQRVARKAFGKPCPSLSAPLATEVCKLLHPSMPINLYDVGCGSSLRAAGSTTAVGAQHPLWVRAADWGNYGLAGWELRREIGLALEWDPAGAGGRAGRPFTDFCDRAAAGRVDQRRSTRNRDAGI